MPTATMTSKGQMTVPVEIRRQFGLRAGTRVDVTPEANGFRVVPESPSSTLMDLAGMLKATRHVTVEAMEQAIADGARESAGL